MKNMLNFVGVGDGVVLNLKVFVSLRKQTSFPSADPLHHVTSQP